MIFPDNWVAEAKLRPGKIIGSVPTMPQTCKCLNCGDLMSVAIFRIDGGPFPSVPQFATSRYINDIPGMTPGWYTGKSEEAPCPVCAGNKNEKFLLELSGLYEDELDWGFGHYWPKDGKDSAKRIMQDLAANPRPVGFVTLYGEHGVGKTYLMKIAVNELRQAGIPAAYRTLAGLLSEARELYDEEVRRKSAESLIDEYSSIQVLCLDELDKVKLTTWVQETVFRLLDTRYARMGDRLTVLATNKHPEELGDALRYLISRMDDARCKVINVGGADMRAPREQESLWR